MKTTTVTTKVTPTMKWARIVLLIADTIKTAAMLTILISKSRANKKHGTVVSISRDSA